MRIFLGVTGGYADFFWGYLGFLRVLLDQFFGFLTRFFYDNGYDDAGSEAVSNPHANFSWGYWGYGRVCGFFLGLFGFFFAGLLGFI
jgi:hypothetical protein